MSSVYHLVRSNFEERQQAVRMHLRHLCLQAQLPSLFQGFSKWAIVGGVVRDLLLSKRLEQIRLCIDFPDIDIAVNHPPSENNFMPAMHRHASRLKISKNSFGGLKLEDEVSGIIDVWCWEDTNGSLSSETLLALLDRVDFGINAVAYLWPDDVLCIHPRWLHDLELQLVEKLAPKSPQPQFQPIRACAVAAKISKATGHKFKLGPNITNDLRKILGQDSAALVKALDYLSAKVDSKRWPDRVASRFSSEWNAAMSNVESGLESLVQRKLGLYLSQTGKRKSNFESSISPINSSEFHEPNLLLFNSIASTK